jgi:hypothetical protein
VSLGTHKSFLVLFFKKERKKKNFFFEKKKQKTFVCWAARRCALNCLAGLAAR